MERVESELKIPSKYLHLIDGRICATVKRSWLSSLLTAGPNHFVLHDRLSAEEIVAQPSEEELGCGWMRIYIKVYTKQKKNAIPLPRGRQPLHSKVQTELTFAQMLHYVSETNYRNLWKESYKKYYSPWIYTDQKEHSNINGMVTDTEVMYEVLARLHSCHLVQMQNGIVTQIKSGSLDQAHCNLLPALLAVETSSNFYILYEQTAKFSLRECVSYSPAILSTCNTKPLFLIYQLLRLSRDLHDLGLVLGEITLSDILIMDNLTIQVVPNLYDNIYIWPDPEPAEKPTKSKELLLKNLPAYDPSIGLNESIESLCESWIHGNISNFDYLTALNNLAGRRYNDPNCHHVMPWVTDFTSRCGSNWRDLTKSKYRLNKGDRQLDLTFDSQTNEVGHHVSDVLSEITYYVYLSRRFSKTILCKHVRPLWVPWEYPGSIQRLYDWSPDECIPQFYTDPSVFKSVHEDMPDLEIPAWATSPEDFIEKHREALESIYVSERLHHWIDLTFGYKLSGSAAIKSKNICRQLVDNHTSLMSSGVVQLFTQPHPQKILASPYWSKFPPRNQVLKEKTIKIEKSSEVEEEDPRTTEEDEDDEEESPVALSNQTKSSPLALSRFLSRSRGSLLTNEENPKPEKVVQIVLPKDFNPVAALVQVETTHAFMNKIGHRVYKPRMSSQGTNKNLRQIVAAGRIREQQILGCLMLEIFLPGKFRANWNVSKNSFETRLKTCLNITKATPEAIPRCIKNAVSLLLQSDCLPKSYNLEQSDSEGENFRYPTISRVGLPPPSSHQFLQPVLCANLFPSTSYSRHLFRVIEMIQEYDHLVRELNFVTQARDSNETMSNTRLLFLCKISECKVKAVARQIDVLFKKTNSGLQLIVPHVKQLLDEPYSAVLTAWHLFDPIAKVLGPKESASIFLLPILKLNENGSVMDNWPVTDSHLSGSVAKFKTMRLYHRTFLLKLIVRLGMKRFLDNFITPLVEAVGGYRDHLASLSSSNLHRTGNLKTCYLSGNSVEGENVLSPLDEDSSVELDHNILSANQKNDYRNVATTDNDSEGIFTMETEDSPQAAETYKEDDPGPNSSDDYLLEETKSTSSDVIKSPVIPIPKREAKLLIDFNSIDCHVGSKTSSEDAPFSLEGEIADEEKSCEEETIPPRTVEKTKRLGRSECKVSEMSAESTIWLSHRLGPVLTARHLSRNLLRMLSLCYAGTESLTVLESRDRIGYSKCTLVGDVNAAKVLECLISIAGLYGEQIIVRQYFPHVAELLALCKRKLTLNLEGGLVSCVALLINVLPCLSDSTLMDVLQEIVRSILYPTVRILSTSRYTYPNGTIARMALADKYLEALAILSTRLGSVMTKSHLAVPIQRFFLAFDKVFDFNEDDGESSRGRAINIKRNDDSKILIVTKSRVKNAIQTWYPDSYSPPVTGDENSEPQRNKAFEELKAVFTEHLAHTAYLTFYRILGETDMNEMLKNHCLVRILCQEYEQGRSITSPSTGNEDYYFTTFQSAVAGTTDNSDVIEKGAGSFGNISVTGNRIEVLKDIPHRSPSTADGCSSTGRQLRGNWLAYWEHEIGRSEKDAALNIKQIKLQTFGGHSNSVRCLYVLDNENSFMSGARDKTVKLWSLRSQGDGSTVSSCQYTYTGHKKSILSLTFLESLRYAVTCDGAIHCWDPFMGSLVGCPESPRPAPVNVLTASPAPSSSLLVGTTDITLRVIDCRTFQYINEMKVSMNPTGLIRCIAVAPSGNWVVLGQASGFLTILDIRTGLIIASWKGHECEILQLEAVDDSTVISSSLDQTIAVWSAVDGKLKFHMKGITEPVHCMAVYENQLVSGTTANRIGVHTGIESSATFSSSKLKSDVFKGVLTNMAVLPLNRLLLLGADNGAITLIC